MPKPITERLERLEKFKRESDISASSDWAVLWLKYQEHRRKEKHAWPGRNSIQNTWYLLPDWVRPWSVEDFEWFIESADYFRELSKALTPIYAKALRDFSSATFQGSQALTRNRRRLLRQNHRNVGLDRLEYVLETWAKKTENNNWETVSKPIELLLFPGVEGAGDEIVRDDEGLPTGLAWSLPFEVIEHFIITKRPELFQEYLQLKKEGVLDYRENWTHIHEVLLNTGPDVPIALWPSWPPRKHHSIPHNENDSPPHDAEEPPPSDDENYIPLKTDNINGGEFVKNTDEPFVPVDENASSNPDDENPLPVLIGRVSEAELKALRDS